MLVLAGCGDDPASDAGRLDAGASDAGTSDAASVDAGGSDAGVDDAGVAVPSCETSAFMIGGVRRGYILCTPTPLSSGALPVVLGFHGGGGNAAAWRNVMAWDQESARAGFIAVYMQGCRTGLTDCATERGSFGWNVGKPGESNAIDDQAFTSAVLDRLRVEHGLNVDLERIFATGHSLGGIFTYSLRCDRPDLLAAIGPISAPPSDGTCTPDGDTSIYHVHGTADANVPFDTGCCSRAQRTVGSPSHLPACDALPECFNGRNWWPPVRDGAHPFADLVGLEEMATASLGCVATRTAITERPPCEAYAGCRAGTQVEECLVAGASHSLRDIDGRFDVVAYLWGRFATH